MDHVRPSRISGPPKTGPFHLFRLSLCVLIYGSFCSLWFMFYLFPLIVQLMSVCVLLLFLDPDVIVASRLPSFCVHVVALVFSGCFRFDVVFLLCFLWFHLALFERSWYVLCWFKCYVCFRFPCFRKRIRWWTRWGRCAKNNCISLQPSITP